MEIKIIEHNHVRCAQICGSEPVITDTQSALDVLMRAKYEAETSNIIISKALVAEEFFVLSTGLAGEILQKYVNYGGRIAIFGDFSRYTSKPLRDFIYESNQGRDVFFAAAEEEALRLMTR